MSKGWAIEMVRVDAQSRELGVGRHDGRQEMVAVVTMAKADPNARHTFAVGSLPNFWRQRPSAPSGVVFLIDVPVTLFAAQKSDPTSFPTSSTTSLSTDHGGRFHQQAASTSRPGAGSREPLHVLSTTMGNCAGGVTQLKWSRRDHGRLGRCKSLCNGVGRLSD